VLLCPPLSSVLLLASTVGDALARSRGSCTAAGPGLVNLASLAFIASARLLAVVGLVALGAQRGVLLAAILLTLLPEVARDFGQQRQQDRREEHAALRAKRDQPDDREQPRGCDERERGEIDETRASRGARAATARQRIADRRRKQQDGRERRAEQD
ncbi:hypothetical protein CF645_38325, partial [Burkholderia pseudomallei]